MADQFNAAVPPQNPVHQFFADPKNLATGLVFLAALAQGPRRGQNTAGQVGERALGALAFRGGLDKGMRNERIQDQQIESQNLERTRNEEHQLRAEAAQQQGLGLQRENMSQVARLASEENASRERVALAETPAERALKESQANYYNRMPKDGSGTDKSPLGGEELSKLIQAQWEQELKDASLAGRSPDPIKMANSISDLVQAWKLMEPGTVITRGPDGQMMRYIPDPNDPSRGQPGATPMPAAQPSAFTMPATGVDFSTAQPSVPTDNPKRIRPRGSNTPDPTMDQIRQLTKIPEPQLRQFLKDPRLTKEQLVAVREELRSRDVRARALNSSSPGLR